MYEEYFGLVEKPFNITPDPKYFYMSAKHREALDSLLYAIADRRGFVVITGEIGSGKTITCKTLLSRLDENVKAALITNTYLTNKQLIMNILEEFGVPYEPGDKYVLLRQLRQFFEDEYSMGHTVVLIIDEAQNLSRQALEEIRMLSNFETEKDKLVQIILIGQPELKDKLYHKSLQQLRQRVSIHYHLVPLTGDETIDFIRHRVRAASKSESIERSLFTSDAMAAIHKYSGGVPRLINIIADNSLLTAYARDVKIVDSGIVNEAVRDSNIMKV